MTSSIDSLFCHELMTLQTHHMNLMAGPQGPIWILLLHKVCSNINTSLIQLRKAAIYCIHRDLHDQLIILKL
jgi:hypothetical protein